MFTIFGILLWLRGAAGGRAAEGIIVVCNAP